MRSSSRTVQSVSEPSPEPSVSALEQAAFQQARIARALADCRQAWERAYKERRDQDGARCFCLQYGARAYRSRMPMPTTAADLPVFMACFTQAIVLQVFNDKEQSRLMQAAKLAREFLPPSADPLDDSLYTWDFSQLSVPPQAQPAMLDTLTAAADPTPSAAQPAPIVGAPSFPRSLRKGWERATPANPPQNPLENLTAVLAAILLTDPELPHEPRKNSHETSPDILPDNPSIGPINPPLINNIPSNNEKFSPPQPQPTC